MGLCKKWMSINKKILFEKKIKTKNFLKLGDRLYTPQKILEKAKTKRVYYHL